MSEQESSAAPGLSAGAAPGHAGEPRTDGRVSRGRRVVKRVLRGIGVAVGVVLAAAALLWTFGGMERPAPEYRAAYDQLVADGGAVPVPNSFVIRIPGCRCHSTDPVAQVEHSAYHIKDCIRCH